MRRDRGSASALERTALSYSTLPIGPVDLHADRLDGLPERRACPSARDRGDGQLAAPASCVCVERHRPGPVRRTPVMVLSVCIDIR